MSVDTVVTDFTWVDSYTIRIASAPVAGGVVEIRRITPKDSAIVSFQDGSTLLEADLDLMVTYNLYCAQEAYDGTQASIHLTADGVWDGQGVRATDFADPVDAQDLMTLNYMNVNFKNTMLAIEQDSIDKTTAIRTAANSDLEAIHTTAVNDLNTITQAAEAATSASQTAAKTSETNAANSAAAASASETASAASQAAAKTSETNAATSEQQAAGYAASLKLPAATGRRSRLFGRTPRKQGWNTSRPTWRMAWGPLWTSEAPPWRLQPQRTCTAQAPRWGSSPGASRISYPRSRRPYLRRPSESCAVEGLIGADRHLPGVLLRH